MSRSDPRSGQSSLEFITMITLVLLVFTGFTVFFTVQQSDAVDAERTRAATSIADQAAYELDLALAQGDGFARTITLPERVAGTPYTITHDNGTIRLIYDNNTVLSPTAATDVTGSITSGTVTFKNTDGVIHVTSP